MRSKDRIIVALDVPNQDKAIDIMYDLQDHVGLFKVGLELICAEGLRDLLWRFSGYPMMLDLKLADIPNTVRGALKAVGQSDAAKAGNIKFVTVHATAGAKTLDVAVEEADKFGAKVLAVTVLTSITPDHCKELYRRTPDEQVMTLAEVAFNAGVQGVVCSPDEASIVRRQYSRDDFVIVTPGIRPSWAETNDQARVASPGVAISRGADYVVVGRPILQPPEGFTPVTAAQSIALMIDDALRL